MTARSLADHIPEKGFRHPDDAFAAFLTWVSDAGLTLYRHQEEALLEIFAGNHVVLDSPTGSGKSLVATALLFKTFAELGHAWYTAPIKALVSEKFFALCAVFGPEHVGLMTGDGTVNHDAPIICCTQEILSNLALRQGERAGIASVVMDEFHYYADRDRGMAWQVPLLTLPKTTFLLMSATLGDTSAIQRDLELRTGRPVREVRGVHRPVPLEYAYSMRPIQDALGELVRQGKAPVYAVHFTQNDATEQAAALMSVDWCTKEEKRAIAEAVRGFRFQSPFGGTLRRLVLHGVGLHHAGLLPRYRLLVERLAQEGLLKVICGTDTLGVGINVPIRTVLFTQLCKFDGEKVDILKVRDFKQIAGRAGRAGFDTVGYVVAQAPEHVIENARLEEKISDPKKRRKVVKAKPPTRGYKHWDENTFRQLVERRPEPLEGRFKVDHGVLLTLLQQAQDEHDDARRGIDALGDLIEISHSTAAQKEELKAAVQTLLGDLEAAGVVTRDGERLRLNQDLQREFSLHHSLSLFLLDALAQLAPPDETIAPKEALDPRTRGILTWVEAILEDPRPILYRQADRERTRIIQELKAAGVPFEDRVAAVEDVTWPKPHAEEIYAFFNDYVTHRPWIADDAIRPKWVVGEMASAFASFADTIKGLGAERFEGVLLRYVTEVYKALLQNVPQDYHDERLLDVIAWLRAMLATVDSSLLMEWEKLLQGADVVAAEAARIDVSADQKSFFARIRAEMHALVSALARREWEEAAGCVRTDERAEWSSEAIEEAVLPFLEEYGEIVFDHRSRLGEHTTIRKMGPHQWTVLQALLARAPADDDDDEARTGWAIEAHVDLRGDTNPEGPLASLVRIGP